MKTDRIIKITAAICFVLVAIAVLVAWNSPATGYEPSIYTATPLMVWVLLATTIICGVSISVHQLFTRRSESNSLWVLGLSIVLLSCTAILSLYIIRGYAMWGRGDFSTHLGTIKNIISVGHIERQNYYPITHIYIAEFSLVCNIVPSIIGKFLFPVLFPFYALITFLLARFVLPNTGQAALATIATTTFVPFISGWLINPCPNHLANLVFPLALFLLLKGHTAATSRLEFRILSLILIFLIPIFHPVLNLTLILVLLTLGLPQLLFAFRSKSLIKPDDNRLINYAPSLLILTVWGITWISLFGLWNAVLSNILGADSQFQQLVSSIGYGQSYGYSAVKQFFIVYGGKALFVLLTIISLPMLRNGKLPSVYLRRLGSLWNALAILVLTFLLLYATNLIFGPGRIIPYIMVLCTIYVGFVLYRVLTNKWFSRHKNYFVRLCSPLVVIISLALAFTSGILNFYSSPLQLTLNNQSTLSETEGMSWFFNNRNIDVATSCIIISPRRFADMLLSREEKGTQGYIPRPIMPPHHFGYDECPTLGTSYTEDSYMVLAKIDRDLYTYVWPEVAEIRFLPSDFERLEHDRSLDKLYSNRGLDIWYVHHPSTP